jgi:uncharacterized membrane protein
MLLAGVMHFVSPRAYERIVPRRLPAPRALVYVSGAFEALGGLGLFVPQTRRFAAWGLIALFVAVFPANVNQAIHRLPLGRLQPPAWVLWLRLPLQAVFIAWAWAVAT